MWWKIYTALRIKLYLLLCGWWWWWWVEWNRFFFSRENQNIFRKNFRRVSDLRPWNFISFREKNLKTVRENTIFLPNDIRENTNECTWKIDPTYSMRLEVFLLFSTCEKKCSSVKIIKNSLIPPRGKKNPPVKKSKKVSVKTLDGQWKCGKTCAWKALFLPWKSKKRPKLAFTRTFDFHGGKNHRWVYLWYFLGF